MAELSRHLDHSIVTRHKEQSRYTCIMYLAKLPVQSFVPKDV